MAKNTFDWWFILVALLTMYAFMPGFQQSVNNMFPSLGNETSIDMAESEPINAEIEDAPEENDYQEEKTYEELIYYAKLGLILIPFILITIFIFKYIKQKKEDKDENEKVYKN